MRPRGIGDFGISEVKTRAAFELSPLTDPVVLPDESELKAWAATIPPNALAFANVRKLGEADRRRLKKRLERAFPQHSVFFDMATLQLIIAPIGQSQPEPVPVDGDDYTWDWHAAQSGSLGPVDLTPTGTMTGGAVLGLRYDVRTGPERVSWEVATAMYAMERQLALLQQRVAALEAELERWRGEM